MTIGQQEPSGIGSRAVAAVVGTLAVGLITMIPFIGCLFALALALTGMGSIAI